MVAFYIRDQWWQQLARISSARVNMWPVLLPDLPAAELPDRSIKNQLSICNCTSSMTTAWYNSALLPWKKYQRFESKPSPKVWQSICLSISYCFSSSYHGQVICIMIHWHRTRRSILHHAGCHDHWPCFWKTLCTEQPAKNGGLSLSGISIGARLHAEGPSTKPVSCLSQQLYQGSSGLEIQWVALKFLNNGSVGTG